MRRPTRGQIGVALLFALPPGAGIVGYSANFTGGRVTLPGVATGAATAVVIFGAVLFLATTGSASDRERFDLPDPDGESNADADGESNAHADAADDADRGSRPEARS